MSPLVPASRSVAMLRALPLAVFAQLIAAATGCAAPPDAAASRPLERIIVSPDRRGFVLEESGEPFIPWGFNYDHDDEGERLIEEYWEAEWEKVVEDFREMKALGASVVRIHLQFGKLMTSPAEAEPAALARLGKLLDLCEELGVYLDITGLGCYLKPDVPAWYDALDEEGRWKAQAAFWSAVAERCAPSPAVFCYDLMNEPVVPGGGKPRDDWLGPPFAGRFHFVQFITRDLAGRERPDVARAWIRRLSRAIREHDPRTPITVGLVPWSLDRPGLTSGFVPEVIAPELDFVSAHIYPERDKLDEALETLAGFQVGKPVVIEETFPLRCSAAELRRFFRDSRAHAAGWIGFYWGTTIEECRSSPDLRHKLMLAWLELFVEEGKAMREAREEGAKER